MAIPQSVFDPAGVTHHAMDKEKAPVGNDVMFGSAPDAPTKRRTTVAFSHVCDESEGDDADALMALRCLNLCEHASYNSERKFHKGANGHTRFIMQGEGL